MENKNILMLRHHPMNVLFTNTFYTSQTENDLSDYIIIDVTSRIERNKSFMAEHPNFGKELSPFFIGPVITSNGTKANIFEVCTVRDSLTERRGMRKRQRRDLWQVPTRR